MGKLIQKHLKDVSHAQNRFQKKEEEEKKKTHHLQDT